MRKKSTILILILVLALTIAGCGGDSSSSGSAPKAEIKGERFEAEGFSVIVPDKWEAMDIKNGIQMYKPTNETIKITLKKDAQSAQVKTKGVTERYEGSEPKEVEFIGIKFLTTSFEYSGMDQTYYYADLEEELLFIETVKGDYNTPEFAGIIDSIEFK